MQVYAATLMTCEKERVEFYKLLKKVIRDENKYYYISME